MTEGGPHCCLSPFLEAKRHRAGRLVARTSSSEQVEAHGREARLGRPPECDDPCIAAPRCAGVAEVVLRSHEKLFQAVKRYGSIVLMLRADSPVTDAARFT